MQQDITPQRVWLRFLRLHQRLQALGTQTLRPIGLSPPQFDVLSNLIDHEGMSQSELAQRLFVTKGNVSGLIDRLVEAGYVERRATPGDRRSNALHLTQQGRAVADKGMALQSAHVNRTLSSLSKAELAELHRLLGRWRDTATST
jgi:MarR family transcriptional regulator, organic hydroperoxide resistance regulator